MTVGRGWRMGESHLPPDAVVAFVDQELSLGAQERAAAHLAHCPRCAAEVATQRSVSAAVRQARTPTISAGFLASLREIPHTVDLPSPPDHLAVGADGQVMAVQRPNQVAGLRDGLPPGALGTSAPLGTSPNVLGNGPRLGLIRRRATQGAGVVVSGLVLSALALVATTATGDGGSVEADPESATPRTGVLPAAKMGAHGPTYAPEDVQSTSTTVGASTTSTTTTTAHPGTPTSTSETVTPTTTGVVVAPASAPR
ncbi:anti-sigma factor family protein [Saccharomonospora glauca]|uniref:Putative zinc-finger domain-containing protein n=1 Tax=Saccharomonospora glauca K62 TaxID=928724 RepID=I1CY84_9PSEU|nr:zf-HC2 domain-containing protein [Saccharomonospora glauca]EIE97658.1 hypothetical protein SacglDRAFT_00712 [Saccharomonospora glauca K62]